MTAPTPCSLFVSLEQRIRTLKEKFVSDLLKAESDDPAAFTPDPDRLAAFRLLVHAEFEEFLESKAREGLDKLERGFNSGVQGIRDNTVLIVTGAVLGKIGKFERTDWPAFAAEVIAAARDVISKNNGIKETSFAALAVFSGKMPDEVDVSLSSALTAYGKQRGDVAHKSAARVRTLRAPSAECKDAEDLLEGLKAYYYY